MSPPPGAVTVEAGGVRVRVRLTPRSSREAILGFETLSNGESVLAAHVRAVPEKGLANAALERLLAEALDVAKSKVEVVAGGTSRLKLVRIAGDPARLVAGFDLFAKA